MYFVSIDEFDYLVEALRSNKIKFGTLLREISAADMNRESKRLQISEHLARRWGRLPVPRYIDQGFDGMFCRAMRALGADSADSTCG